MPTGVAIPEYVHFILEHFGEVTDTPDGWLAHCRCENHGRGQGDVSPSVRITVGAEGRLLVTCRTGCPTHAVLSAVGLRFDDLFPGADDVPMEPLAREVEEEPTGESITLRDQVYSFMLDRLALSQDDRQTLLERGLSPEAIDSGKYRTLLRTRHRGLLRHLYSEFQDSLYSVPGFKLGNDDEPAFATQAEGLLIPVANHLGQIVALKVRRTREPREGESRYYYLSGGQVSSGSPCHFPLGVGFEDEVRVTEGELKAAIATDRTGVYTVSVPGVSQWRPLVAKLQILNVRRVRVAYDWPDVQQNYSVFQQWDSFLSCLRACDFEVSVEMWDGECKGIDDVLVAALPLVQLTGDAIHQIIQRLQRHFHPTSVSQPVALPAIESLPATQQTATWQPAPFPVEIFPEALQAFIRRVAASKQCPVDFPGVGCLVVAGSMIGSSRGLCIKGGWVEKPALYAVIVAPPGSAKTPALDACLAPVYPLLTSENVRGELLVEDTTVEALAGVLQTSPSGVLLSRDELTAWVRSMDQYKGGKGTDRQFYLSCWSGKPIRVHRKSLTDPISVPNPFVSVLGGIQPDLLSELEDRAGREDGFLHRLLFSCPLVELPTHWDETGLDVDSTRAWADIVNNLYALRPIPDENGRTPPPLEIRFSAAGMAAWVEWYNSHLTEMHDSTLPKELHGPWAKYTAYMARFTLILHYLHRVCEAGFAPATQTWVSPEDLRRAAMLVNYFKSHTRVAYGRLRSKPEDSDVERMCSWLENRPEKTGTLREVMRALHLSCKSATSKIFKRAQDLGRGEIKIIQRPNTRKGVEAFRLYVGNED